MKVPVFVFLVASIAVTFAREEIHHIHSENGRNVHVHLHEAGACSEEPHHHHHHHDDQKDGSHVGHMDEKDKHPEHHKSDNDIHIHIHEAGENCTNHGDHGAHTGDFLHPGDHHGGASSGHACAMCARALGHHGELAHDDHSRDHPGHHGPHTHGEDAEKHDHSEDYAYAHCEMSFNKAASKKDKVKIKGAVHMRQLIYGGPVEMMVELRGFKVHKEHMQHTHSFNVHEFGDLSDGCQSTGSHFNPFGAKHGAQDSEDRHAGDLGTIQCDEKGVVMMQMNDSRTTLIGHHNIIGRALVIGKDAESHEEETNKPLDPANRLACCIIVRSKPHGHWASDEHDHSGDHHHDPHDDHGDHADHEHDGHDHDKQGHDREGKMKMKMGKKSGKKSKKDHDHSGHQH